MGRPEPMGRGGDEDPLAVGRPEVFESAVLGFLRAAVALYTVSASLWEDFRGGEIMLASGLGLAWAATRGSLLLRLLLRLRGIERQAGVRRAP